MKTQANFLAVSLASFAVACGAVLLLASGGSFWSGGDDAEPATATQEPETRPEVRVVRGLEQTRLARRALADGNYGDAREYLTRVEESLTWLLADIGGERLELSGLEPRTTDNDR